MSKLQRKVSEMLSRHVGGYEIYENVKPHWLQMQDGTRLELDFYLPGLHTAIEVQGRQHYEYTPFFHSSYDDFLSQQKRDEAKRALCQSKDVKLIAIDDEEAALEAVYALSHQDAPDLLHPRAAEQLLKDNHPMWILTTRDRRYMYDQHMSTAGYPKTIRRHMRRIFGTLIKQSTTEAFTEKDIARIDTSLYAIAQHEEAMGSVTWTKREMQLLDIAKNLLALRQ